MFASTAKGLIVKLEDSNMKKLIIITMILGGFLLVPAGAQADFRDDLNKQLSATAGEQGANFAPAQDPRIVAALIIRQALTLLGTFFLAMIVYAGYVWATSAGEEDKIDTARKTIKRSAIGLIVILTSYSVVLFVSTLVETSDTPSNGVIEQPLEPFDLRRSSDFLR